MGKRRYSVRGRAKWSRSTQKGLDRTDNGERDLLVNVSRQISIFSVTCCEAAPDGILPVHGPTRMPRIFQ